MRDSVIDVLFYIFDDIMSNEQILNTDVKEITSQLSEAGFMKEDVQCAVDWFVGLSELKQDEPELQCSNAVRVFSAREGDYLGLECQEYLRYISRHARVSMGAVEKIIDCTIALGVTSLPVEILRWISAMVLVNIEEEFNEAMVLGMDGIICPPTLH
ncbi:DUF494 domain-containing protein [Suttonella sp. R2A3]|uniref:DUF494 family protein n=1 Tax=Suttonella sp. R2A3 TaxID=2908648 RepID=UPI001F34A4EA|nr:DUF494 family protein [Suttonella sp. R2A3]UJF24178.1 DUF494 domain-containing protein [Suttonella sp. R2A3]